MKCNFCGAAIDEGTVVCPVCNKTLCEHDTTEKTMIDEPIYEDSPAEDFSNQSFNQNEYISNEEEPIQENTNVSSDEIYSSPLQNNRCSSSNYVQDQDAMQPEASISETSETLITEKKKPKKMATKKKVIIIVSAVIGVLAILCSLLYIFRAYILMWLAPKEYAAYCLSNTIDSLDKDIDTLMEEYLGFKPDKNTDFTLENALKLNDVKTPYSNFNLSYAPSNKAMMVNLEDVKFYGENVKMDILWNDNIIGLHIPEVSEDKYFAVRSKTFGDQVMDTKLTFLKEKIQEEKVDLTGTDISFSNIMGESALTEKEKEALKEKVVDSVMEFIESGKVEEKGKSAKVLDGEEESVHTLTVSFKGEDVRKALLDIVNIVENDKSVKRQYGNKLEEYTADIREKLKKADFKDDVLIDFELTDDKAVTVNIRVPGKKITMSLDVRSIEVMLNKAQLVISTPTISFDTAIDGNIIPIDNKSDFTLNINYGGKFIGIDAKLDFEDNKATVGLDTSEIDKIIFDGSCYGGNGFNLSLNSGKNKIDFSLNKDAAISRIPGYEYMILEKTEGFSMMMELSDVIGKESGRNIIINISKHYLGEDNKLMKIIETANSLLNGFTDDDGGNKGGFLSGLFK